MEDRHDFDWFPTFNIITSSYPRDCVYPGWCAFDDTLTYNQTEMKIFSNPKKSSTNGLWKTQEGLFFWHYFLAYHGMDTIRTIKILPGFQMSLIRLSVDKHWIGWLMVEPEQLTVVLLGVQIFVRNCCSLSVLGRELRTRFQAVTIVHSFKQLTSLTGK